MNVSEFVLKATPPRMPRATLERAHLQALRERHHDCTALLAECLYIGMGRPGVFCT